METGTLIVSLTGKGGNTWVNITRSLKENKVRNIRMLPKADMLKTGPALPTFNPGFLKGLAPFQALRFMDWMSINGSTQKTWTDRVRLDTYSQGTDKGIAIEYAIQVANQLHADPWFCMPHQADDDYILRFAALVKATLDPSLRGYLEYSNEIWNFQFDQGHWIGENAAGAHDSIRNGLANVGVKYCKDAKSYCHPEKDAYMMNRTFRLWRSVFTGPDTARMVRVAAVQHGWYDNTGRVLKYLFTDGNGCDAVAPAGYFNFAESDHLRWLAMNPDSVTPEMVIDAASRDMDSTTFKWTRETAKFAVQYKVSFLVYEGGQHMQPYLQADYAYNHAVWDAQIHPKMFDLYQKNFAAHMEPGVDCKLFMAFSYVGDRESRYGSWGHLENYDQLDATNIKTIAPKYAALLEANTGKPGIPIRFGAKMPQLQKNSKRSVYLANGIRVRRASGKQLKVISH